MHASYLLSGELGQCDYHGVVKLPGLTELYGCSTDTLVFTPCISRTERCCDKFSSNDSQHLTLTNTCSISYNELTHYKKISVIEVAFC